MTEKELAATATWWKGEKIEDVPPLWGSQPSIWMTVALSIAEQNSRIQDPSTRLGAVLQSQNERIFTGFNQPVIGVGAGQLEDREFKMAVTEHAETSVIMQALISGEDDSLTTDSILYAPWASCPECARLMARTGVGCLVVHEQAMLHTPEDWRRPISHGYHILREAGIRIYKITEALGHSIQLRGQTVEV